MKKKLSVILLAAMLLLCGCTETKEVLLENTELPTSTVEETVPATIPADGNPEDVTCKGSYTGEAADVVVKKH